MKNKINYFILFPIILLCILFSSCGVSKSTLEIKNWPYTGTGILRVYIDENPQKNDEKKENKGLTEEQKK